MPLPEELIAEADRQLGICNACRYCEGYCPVFPSLARWRELDEAAITHLANLCHDCRDCFHACMYVAPHEFALNPPVVLSAVRRATYAEGRGRLGRYLAAPGGAVSAVAIVVGIVLALAAGSAGLGRIVTHPRGPASPYWVIAKPGLIVLGAASLALGVVAIGIGARSYWRTTRPRPLRVADLGRAMRAVHDGLTLQYARGGGVGCEYPGEEPNGLRRGFHLAVVFGVLLCFASTIAAAITEDLAGSPPPYGLVSVPVLAGLIGGIGIVVGCIGFLALKSRADPLTGEAEMARADLALIVALGLLAATGLLTLALRTTDAYGVVLVIHLSIVAASFLLAPFSKFVHGVYRTLALVAEELARA
jgi:citrate/tricarballylate utilization protein